MLLVTRSLGQTLMRHFWRLHCLLLEFQGRFFLSESPSYLLVPPPTSAKDLPFAATNSFFSPFPTILRLKPNPLNSFSPQPEKSPHYESSMVILFNGERSRKDSEIFFIKTPDFLVTGSRPPRLTPKKRSQLGHLV